LPAFPLIRQDGQTGVPDWRLGGIGRVPEGPEPDNGRHPVLRHPGKAGVPPVPLCRNTGAAAF
jgi:hypothetical protein